MATLSGHFAVFNEWTTIDSPSEGHFLERIAPGAFAKTFAERGSKIRVLFQHGRDPYVGDKPLGPIQELREDEQGAYYSARLLDAHYVNDLVPGLRAGLYGASFRFRAIREVFDPRPGRSAHNPDGIPQRTLNEVAVHELGPVTFGAYDGATASVRSQGGGMLSPAGRVETLDRSIANPAYAGEPHVYRRLRKEARSSRGAARLLHALENGERVAIDWTNLTASSQNTRRKRTSPYLLPTNGGQSRYLLPTTAKASSWRL